MNIENVKMQVEMLINVIDVNIEIHQEDIDNHNGSAYLIQKERIVANLKGQKEAYNNVLNWCK